jgi:hypothetical protein
MTVWKGSAVVNRHAHDLDIVWKFGGYASRAASRRARVPAVWKGSAVFQQARAHNLNYYV